MKALITGITGFVGSWLAEHLLEQGLEVHGLVRWRSPRDNILHIEDRLQLHEGDLIDLPSLLTVLNNVSPHYIFHLAAQSYVPYSYKAPVATLQTNVIGTANLLEAVREADMLGVDPVIVVCSSSEVYGQVTPEDVPIKEACPLRPVSPYGVSKAGEDLLAQMYFTAYHLNIIRVRLFTHTGPRRGEVFAESSFARQIALIEAGLQEPVIHTGNLDSMRCWLDVRDAARAYWLLAQKCPPGEVYNIGGDVQMTVGAMLSTMLNLSSIGRDPSQPEEAHFPEVTKFLSGMKRELRQVKEAALLRPADVTLQVPDSTKFRLATGWQPKVPFMQTLSDLLNYWRRQVGFRAYS